MADVLESVFKNKKIIWNKLAPFGFEKAKEGYQCQRLLADCGLFLTVRISLHGTVSAEVIDPVTAAPYTLHLLDGAAGSFVGVVRSQYTALLTEIASQCFEPDVFQSDQAKALIAYVRETYGDELEYLWPKLPDNAIWRRKDTKKWYAALLTVSKHKLGLAEEGKAEIVDLRLPPEEMAGLLDNQTYFPGYHMNKKHWFTILLDGSVSLEEITDHMAVSYKLAVK